MKHFHLKAAVAVAGSMTSSSVLCIVVYCSVLLELCSVRYLFFFFFKHSVAYTLLKAACDTTVPSYKECSFHPFYRRCLAVRPD